MKHSKFFLVASALTLGIMSIYATKPAKKFGPAPKAYARAPYNSTIFFAPGTTSLTTIAGSFSKARFSTAAGAAVTLRTSSASNAKTLYFKHP